jgi:transposase
MKGAPLRCTFGFAKSREHREENPMNKDKYVGLDVDQATTVVAIEDAAGSFLMETFLPTRAVELREFFKGLKGTIHVALEEGTQATWLYDLIEPLVKEVVVCDPRRNKLIQTGNKGDRIDAQKLARLLRLGELHAVYHGEHGTPGLKELVHGYDQLVRDTARTKNRLKGAFRSRGIGCRGEKVYRATERTDWLAKVDVAAVRARVSSLYEQLDCLRKLREQAHKEMIKEAQKHPAYKLIIEVSGLGSVRTSQIIATVGSPHRFRTKRQFWPYCGLAVVTHMSSEYEIVDGRRRRKNKPMQTRGLNKNFNRTMKAVFKGATETAINKAPFKEYYQRLIDNKMRPEMARLTVARKISAITLAVWKKGEKFDPEKVNQAAPDSGKQ